jgi:putative PIN family toxin of toxin-antitoxin system
MDSHRIVIDTNVWIAALRSQQGASYRLLNLAGTGLFEIVFSVSLVLEYEDTARRLIGEFELSAQDISDILDYLCAIAVHQRVSYLWRPYLVDPEDDRVLELAANAACDDIITFNLKHFRGVEKFGISAVTPSQFLKNIGALP